MSNNSSEVHICQSALCDDSDVARILSSSLDDSISGSLDDSSINSLNQSAFELEASELMAPWFDAVGTVLFTVMIFVAVAGNALVIWIVSGQLYSVCYT